VKPLDDAYLQKALARFDLVVTVEENAVQGGFGSAVLEWAQANGFSPGCLNIGLPDRFVTHGARQKLLDEVGLTAEDIAAKIGAFALPAAKSDIATKARREYWRFP